MLDFKILKCPSCGSSVVETENEELAECSHCGSKLLLKSKNNPTRVFPYSRLIVSLLVLILVGGVLGFYFIQQNKNDSPIVTRIKLPKIGVPNVNFNLPKINSKAITITKGDLTQKRTTETPKVSIVRQVQGKTIIGGLYWIVTIRNDSKQTVFRPGVIVSLFDESNKRIEEQKGWAKIIHLEPGMQTEVLVYVANPPKVNYKHEIKGMGSLSSYLKADQQNIEVVEFIVKPKNNSKINVEIIGDVKNTHDFQVDFIRVVAIAKDQQGNTIGLADSFVSNSSLNPNEQSGFKINAGTFVTKPPDSWSLLAFGKKHRDKL